MTGEPGSLVAIPFPYTDLSTSKRRPALVLTSPDEREDFLVLAVTSRETEGAAEVLETPDLEEGRLPRRSWVRVDKAFTVNSSLVQKEYGRLTDVTFKRVHKAFCYQMGCERIAVV
ncbi:mRNA interferase MazF [Thiohalospira halophila DSM 15071]|uniref:mRNA interferase MazF n=1 Tax=Thiohalospira halophila DSM 15071 TaxID=1123397 RepID=A0A1I1ND46_9GAMM|nr:type II toxin-antitoxin system PemK/MazF family toxin [Thiohalospira halophila]SFC95611.1 mRNA interferase MazF [Thiohalospira halophila DSM 15071]